MSVYTIRHIEGRFSEAKGQVMSIDRLPADASDGDIYRVWNDDNFPYYKKVGNEWVGQNSCPSHWKLLCPMKVLDKKPREPEYPEPEPEFSKTIELFDSNRNTVYMKRNAYFTNNGGAIRDDYISSTWSIADVKFQDRGFPDDMSEETRQSMMDADGEFCKYGYSRTWCTLDEWCELYNSEEKRILGKIRDAYEKQYHDDVNKKLDFLIKNMKAPLSADVDGFYNKDKEDVNGSQGYEDEYCYEETPDVVIEENMTNLFQIAEEIGKISYVADMYGFYGSSGQDIRIIYYLEH